MRYKGESRQKWDSIETKMGQQRDKNGTVSRQENIFVSILKNIAFLCTTFFRHIVHIEGFHIETQRISRQNLCVSM